VERERRAADASHAAVLFAGKEPTPDEALAAADELEAILRELPERGRQALELRLQGYEHEEIAERLHCNERTVRRHLNEARRLMAVRGGTDFVPSAARALPRGTVSLGTKAAPSAAAQLEAPLKWTDLILQEQIG